MEERTEVRKRIVINSDLEVSNVEENMLRLFNEKNDINPYLMEEYNLVEEDFKKESYPEIYNIEKEIKEYESKHEILVKGIKNQIKEYMDEMKQVVESLNQKTELYEENIEKLKEEIKNKKEELNKLESSEKLTEEDKIKIEVLRDEIDAKKATIVKFEEKLKGFKDQTKIVSDDYKVFTDDYKQYIEEEQVKIDEKGNSENKKTEKEEKANNAEKEPKAKGKRENTKSGVASVEKEKQEETLKEKFNRLYKNIKKLSDDEQIELLGIMSNIENYKELGLDDVKGLRTFRLFNKTKTKADDILKVLSKKIGKKSVENRDKMSGLFPDVKFEAGKYPNSKIKDWKFMEEEIRKNPDLVTNIESQYNSILREYGSRQDEFSKKQKEEYKAIAKEQEKISKLKESLKVHSVMISEQNKELPSAREEKGQVKPTIINELNEKTVPPNEINYNDRDIYSSREKELEVKSKGE